MIVPTLLPILLTYTKPGVPKPGVFWVLTPPLFRVAQKWKVVGEGREKRRGWGEFREEKIFR